MSIRDYFKPVIDLPNPEGLLKEEIRPSTIRDVNKKLSPVIQRELQPTGGRSREPYVKLTPEQKALIGRRAAEHGVTATIRYYSKRCEDTKLKEATVRRLKNNYLGELKRKRVRPHEITELPSKKRGRPLLLGEELDRKVKAYLLSLRSFGAVVNTAITLACAKGIVINEDASLLMSMVGIFHLRNTGRKISFAE